MLEVDKLTKRFGGLVAVNELDIELSVGDILSIIGPNGAGKSTCFKLIASFLTPSSGTVKLDGRDIAGIGPHAVAQLGIVRTFQENTIFKDMTVREAVELGHHKDCKASLAGKIFRSRQGRVDDREASEYASYVLSMLGMPELADSIAEDLPHGMLRRLGIAVALAAKPKIILLDEPFAGLNSDETARGVELVRTIRDNGITPILVEHDMAAVMSVSERIIVVNFGSKIAEGAPADIRQNSRVIEAYLGSEDEELGV